MEYRLNKYISASGYCSRREADRYIESGNVTVNGKRAEIGSKVLPGQKVRVNGNLVEADIEPVYIAFNKPVGLVSTTDISDKDNIIDFIGHEQRIFPIGRLDKDSQGLILLTNDGDIVNKILRAGNNHKKEYLVTVNKPITKDFLTRMSQGVPILDRVTRKCEIEEINPYLFKITLIQGLNRQIRRMCEYFNYTVLKLERIQVMNIQLGKLGQGNWRDLTQKEMEGLFDLIEKSEKTENESKSKKKSGTTAKPRDYSADKNRSNFKKPPFKHKDGDDKRSKATSKDANEASAGGKAKDYKKINNTTSAKPKDYSTDKNRSNFKPPFKHKDGDDKRSKATSKDANETSADGKTKDYKKINNTTSRKMKESSGPRVGKQRPEKIKKAKSSNFEKYKYVNNNKKKKEGD